MIAIAAASFFATPRHIHESNGFSFAPILEVCIIFAGLFACLAPIEVNLAALAPHLPIQAAWQLFWCAGTLSASTLTPLRMPLSPRWLAACRPPMSRSWRVFQRSN